MGKKVTQLVIFILVAFIGTWLYLQFRDAIQNDGPMVTHTVTFVNTLTPTSTGTPVDTLKSTSTPTAIITLTSTPNIMPTATLTPTSTLTITPTATFTPTSTSTITPTTTFTPLPPTLTFTPIPSYPSPELIGAHVLNCTVTLKWLWPGTLAEKEHFAIRVWKTGSEEHESVAWEEKLERENENEYKYTYPLSEGGDYTWQIAICRGIAGSGKCEELAVSQLGFFQFGGCSPTLTDTPTKPIPLP